MGTRQGWFWGTLGLLLIAAALILAGANLHEASCAGKESEAVLLQMAEDLETATVEEEPSQTVPYLSEMPVKVIQGREYIGVLNVPSLELELPVISQWSYDGLKIAPCRYTGSAYAGDMILAAHNYSTHFGRLNILQTGDIITFTDMNEQIFVYEVTSLEILQPTSVSEMESGEWDLTLFTCTPGGQSRLAVRCALE